MSPNPLPITDDHIHIDPRNGRGFVAAREFMRSGGTHMFLVSKPSGSFGIVPARGEDFRPAFEETLAVAKLVSEAGLVVFPVLGVHPAEITRLQEYMPLERVVEVMKGGIALAARFVEEGLAVALKSGRPHYPVSPEVWEASCDVLSFALERAGEIGCAVQVHAESGDCADMLEMARAAGLSPDRLVKHYAIPTTPLVPSLIATHPGIGDLARGGREFMMESDYMDELSRPGAVIGPRSVPRITRKLLETGQIDEKAAFGIHAGTPSRVYGVEITL
ncbi:MAG: TatD family hydrolase [Methanolinea sp.]|nr:TatD family hydrolase [Methanolinea sp.]